MLGGGGSWVSLCVCWGGWVSVWRGRLPILSVKEKEAAAALANAMNLPCPSPHPTPTSTGEYDPRRAELELARRQEARQDIKAAHKALILASSGERMWLGVWTPCTLPLHCLTLTQSSLIFNSGCPSSPDLASS